MKHGNGKKLGIEQNNYHLHGEVLANFPNFGLISKIDPKDQCLASFLGLARTAGIQICIWSKQGTYYTNFLVWIYSRTLTIWTYIVLRNSYLLISETAWFSSKITMDPNVSIKPCVHSKFSTTEYICWNHPLW